MWVKKQQLESDMEQLTASKLREEYDKAVYCHPAYLSSMLSCCSVAQLCLTLGPHELQHTRIPCPSLLLFHDPADVGNLISGSSAFSKTSLDIWKFSVHG